MESVPAEGAADPSSSTPAAVPRKAGLREYVRGNWLLVWIGVLILVVGFVVGLFFRSFLPPYVFNGQFWYDALTGPPMAGFFAIVAAILAFIAAWFTMRATRRSAEQVDWWNRAAWAIDLALSEHERNERAGLRTMKYLVRQGIDRNDEMVVDVALLLIDVDKAKRIALGLDPDIDTTSAQRENEEGER